MERNNLELNNKTPKYIKLFNGKLIPFIIIPYTGSNLLFLDEVKSELLINALPTEEVLFRASELNDLDKIITYGTDRGGFKNKKIWGYSNQLEKNISYEDVIIATTEKDIILGEQDTNYMNSIKKLNIIKAPLFLIYDNKELANLSDNEYMFLNPDKKIESLLAIFQVNKIKLLEGWFKQEDGLFYLQLANDIKDGVILEIGSWKGLSTSFIAKSCMRNNNKLFCIDWWEGSTDKYNSLYKQYLLNENVEAIFKMNMKQMGIDINCLKMSSAHAAKLFDDYSIDMVFIDGSHDFITVSNDLEKWFYKIKSGGILAGHDYNIKHSEVLSAVAMFIKQHNLNIHLNNGSIWYIRK